jgi:hypothetical protein
MALVLVAACGGDDGGGGDDDDGGGDRTAEFIGTWTYNPGSQTVIDCENDIGDSTDDATGTFEVQAASGADVMAQITADCPPLKFDVSGSSATAQAGQTCMFSMSGADIMVNFTSGTASLDAAGTELTLSGAATANVTGVITTTCTVNANATATKAL